MEARANKYTFVWKKAVTKNQAKFFIKLADFVAKCEQLYDIKIVYGDTIKIKHVERLRKKLYALKEAENVVFMHGIGKRKTPLQKSIETLEAYLARLKKYNQQIHICGKRNSYSKTDHDATFMRMKEDDCDDPKAGIDEEPFVQAARDAFGKKGADEIASLLKQNEALFAGGALSEDQKDMFFEALSRAYFMNKQHAREKFGRKKK